MPDVQNSLLHMRGQCISIDGHDYKCDEQGIIRGIPEADAKQLVERRSTTWRYYTERKPVVAIPINLVAPVLPLPEDLKKIPEVEVPKVVAEVKTAEKVEEKIPEEGQDWPDPQTSMNIEYLQQMAQAYQVKYNLNTSKATLVKKIMAAMYS